MNQMNQKNLNKPSNSTKKIPRVSKQSELNDKKSEKSAATERKNLKIPSVKQKTDASKLVSKTSKTIQDVKEVKSSFQAPSKASISNNEVKMRDGKISFEMATSPEATNRSNNPSDKNIIQLKDNFNKENLRDKMESKSSHVIPEMTVPVTSNIQIIEENIPSKTTTENLTQTNRYIEASIDKEKEKAAHDDIIKPSNNITQNPKLHQYYNELNQQVEKTSQMTNKNKDYQIQFNTEPNNMSSFNDKKIKNFSLNMNNLKTNKLFSDDNNHKNTASYAYRSELEKLIKKNSCSPKKKSNMLALESEIRKMVIHRIQVSQHKILEDLDKLTNTKKDSLNHKSDRINVSLLEDGSNKKSESSGLFGVNDIFSLKSKSKDDNTTSFLNIPRPKIIKEKSTSTTKFDIKKKHVEVDLYTEMINKKLNLNTQPSQKAISFEPYENEDSNTSKNYSYMQKRIEKTTESKLFASFRNEKSENKEKKVISSLGYLKNKANYSINFNNNQLLVDELFEKKQRKKKQTNEDYSIASYESIKDKKQKKNQTLNLFESNSFRDKSNKISLNWWELSGNTTTVNTKEKSDNKINFFTYGNYDREKNLISKQYFNIYKIIRYTSMSL